MNTLSKLQSYMSGRKYLLPISLAVSAISSAIAMIPFIFIWLIANEILKENSSQSLIESYTWWAVGSAISGLILYFAALTLSHLAAFRVEVNMRKEAMKKIMSFPLGFFDANTSGKIRKIIDDNASITHGFIAHQLPDLAGTIITPIITLGLIFIIDWRMGIACIFPIAGAMAIMSSMSGAKGREFMEKYMNSLEEMNTEAVEYVRGIPVVKVFQQTIYSFKSFHKSIMNYKEMVVKYTKYWDKKMTTYLVVINSFAFVLIPLTIILLKTSASPISTILDMFLYILITPLFASSIMKSMHLSHATDQAKQAIDRLENLCNQEVLNNSEALKKVTDFNIELNNIKFKYPQANKFAIDGISLSIPKGKTFALVGPSGSGKTTLARLIARFWEVESGTVKIGTHNIKNIDNSNLMNNISFVFQNTKLFKTSLYENITFGNTNATMEQVNKAINAAQCRDIIDKLPDGLDTVIGTEGTYLSGGEQQRICLARAILKDAPIVILDEATAFADPENEHLIQMALNKLTKGKTVVMIAHRLSSVVDVDNIVVLDQGKIIEQGNHNKLLSNEGLYSKMWVEFNKSIKWTIKKEAKYA
jgi:ATP-binding cassette subfamily B protein